MLGLQAENQTVLEGLGPLEIAVCGLSYRSAPIDILEQLAFAPEDRPSALAELASGAAPVAWPASEAIILSTCNRVEVYVALPGCQPGNPAAGESLARFLAGYHGVPLDVVAPYLYVYQGQAAVRHLFAVAAGLDSLVLGEPQILGQVRKAFEDAVACGAAGHVLSTLLRRAIETGKRVHSETGIGHGAASVSYAAVEVAALELGDLSGRRGLVIGAGKTGQLAAQCLLGKRIGELAIANRTYESAVSAAASWGGEAYALGDLDHALAGRDVVISCTDAPDYVLTRERVERAVAGRSTDRPLLLVDIAVPRDIDPETADVPGVRLYNLDDLQCVVERNLADRRQHSEQAKAIIQEQVEEFMGWFRALRVVPVITDLRGHAESIRQRELARIRNRLGDLPPAYANIIDIMTQRIVNQLLHEPTVRLKEYASQADGALYAQALRDLFALDDDPDETRGRE